MGFQQIQSQRCCRSKYQLRYHDITRNGTLTAGDYSFFYFYFYSFMRSLVTTRRLKLNPTAHRKPGSVYKPTIVEELVLGFVAGVASRAVSMPMNIVTLRLQTERGDSETDSDDAASDLSEEETATPLNNSDSESGLRSVFASIYREEGLAGFWKGMLNDAE